jgi:hypothetical protein
MFAANCRPIGGSRSFDAPALVIFIDFECKNGRPHPPYTTAVKNYSGLLADTGKSEAEIRAAIAALTGGK